MPGRALLINPYITDFKLYDEWMHPLGLYFLSDLLQRSGIETIFINTQKRTDKAGRFGTGNFHCKEIEKPDLYRHMARKYKQYGRSEQELEYQIRAVPRPDFVCIGSMMTYWAPGVLSTIRVVRSIYPEIPIVIGGTAAQLIPEYFQGRLDSASQIAPSLFSLPSLMRVSSELCSNNQLTITGGLQQLDSLPHGPVLLSLGCPLQCTYCASSILQPKHMIRPLKTVIEETVYLIERFKVKDFSFYDDALLYKPELVLLPFLNAVASRGFTLRFHTPNGLHLRYITSALLDRLKLAGFKTLRFGYESGSSKYSSATSRKTNRNDLASKMDMAKRAGFSGGDLGVYVMGGLQEQSVDELLEEMEFISSLNIKVKPVFLSPVPKTPLFEYYAAQFPEIRHDPLWHNDSFFITRIPGWDQDSVEMIRSTAKDLNSRLLQVT